MLLLFLQGFQRFLVPVVLSLSSSWIWTCVHVCGFIILYIYIYEIYNFLSSSCSYWCYQPLCSLNNAPPPPWRNLRSLFPVFIVVTKIDLELGHERMFVVYLDPFVSFILLILLILVSWTTPFIDYCSSLPGELSPWMNSKFLTSHLPPARTITSLSHCGPILVSARGFEDKY